MGLVVSASISSTKRLRPLGAKVTLVAGGAQRIQRNQSYGIILNRIVDKAGIGRKISACRKGRAQIRSVVPVAGQDIDRRSRLREDSRGPRVFVLPSVMNDIAGVNDHVGGGIERVDVGNRAFEIPNSLIGVRRVQGDMGIGNLRNDHDAGR